MSRPNAKVVLLGKSNAGKTSLLERYTLDVFSGVYNPTIGCGFKKHTEFVGDSGVVLAVWDTAGSERYEGMAPMYYRGSFAAIVCFDITDIHSWRDTERWIDRLSQVNQTCRIYLCATKIDQLLEPESVPRVVSQSAVTSFARDIGAVTAFDTSAKTGQNVRKMFHRIAEDFVESDMHKNGRMLKDPFTVTLYDTVKLQKKRCCLQK